MARENKDENFIKQPVYKGGTKAINEHIQHHLKYPEEALKAKVQGMVHVRYDIDFKGNVVDAKVIKGIGHGCDEEAIRIIKLMKFDTSKSPRKLKVLYHKDLQINFKLPKPKPIVIDTQVEGQGQFKIAYEITKATPEDKKKKPGEQSGGYSYTIQF